MNSEQARRALSMLHKKGKDTPSFARASSYLAIGTCSWLVGRETAHTLRGRLFQFLERVLDDASKLFLLFGSTKHRFLHHVACCPVTTNGPHLSHTHPNSGRALARVLPPPCQHHGFSHARTCTCELPACTCFSSRFSSCPDAVFAFCTT